ncbi:MAG: cation:proton antiporter [Burkholderiaceae bacterium]|nr:cation:proton antiporter [Burkholderiaceae bacterium]
MDEVESIPHLRETLLFLALAGILVPFLQRLRVGSIPGYLAVGMLLGPFGLGRLATPATSFGRLMSWLAFPQLETVSVLAGIGVVFLMFMIGLELSAWRLWSMRRWVFGAGAAQVVVTTALIFAAAAAFDVEHGAALVVGLALSFSSTAVVMQLLTARHDLATPLGQASFAVLLFQDLAVVPVLILVSLLGRPGDSDVLVVLSLALGRAVIAIVVIFVLGRVVLGPLFRQFTANRQADTFMALTLLASLSIASLTWLAGLSMALGAMLAGLLLAETEYRHQVVVMIDPFRGLLMGVFFLSVGMSIDPLAIVHQPLRLLAAVMGLFALKTLVTALVLRAGGLSNRVAIHGGLLLGQGGEFAFVVFGVAATLGLLNAEASRFLLLVVGVSMFVAPVAAALGRAIEARGPASRSRAGAERALVAPQGGGHVVIAGFGRVGQSLARLFDAQAIPYIAVDPDPNVVSSFHAKGWPVYVGDASRGDLLRQLGLAQARAVVLTMDQPVSALHAVRAIRVDAPDVPIFARARDERHAGALQTVGADAVIPETLESALQLGALALERTGMPQAELRAVLARERAEWIAPYGNQSSNGNPT